MPTPEDGCFVGAMPPQLFLDQFMQPEGQLDPAPTIDVSSLSGAESTQDICASLIKAVTESGACPEMQLYQAKTTRRREREDNMDAYYEPQHDFDGNVLTSRIPTIRHLACPAIGVRRRPASDRGRKARAGTKATQGKALYYNFATNVLDVEVVHDVDADPFEDPPETVSSRGSSGRLSSSLRSSVSAEGRSPKSHATEMAHLSESSTTDKTCSSKSFASDRSPSPKPRTPLSPIQPASVSPPITPSNAIRPHTGRSPAPTSSTSPPTPQAGPASPPQIISGSSSSYWTSFERNTIDAEVFRARMIGHVKAEFARQHRLFILQAIIVNRFARFIRWDHAGAVVTERFDFIENPTLLAEFFWRFNHMSCEQRGFDPSVKLATPAEQRKFEAVVTSFLKEKKTTDATKAPSRTLPGAELTLDEGKTYPTWKIRVTDATTSKTTDLIVRRPFSDCSTLWGRATRAYLAYDVTSGRVLCLKDTWRLDNADFLPEAETFRHLMRHGVSHIPELLYGGDVNLTSGLAQDTLSQVSAKDVSEWRATTCVLDKHVHHQLVQEVAYPLENVTDEKHFIQVLCDVLCALRDAYDTAGFLHRDISYRNIMITSAGKGILNDWDHAGPKDKLARGLGTWSTMSTALLQDPDRFHDLVDDLESLFWVLAMGALRHFSNQGQAFDQGLFDEKTRDCKGHLTGGSKKYSALFTGQIHKREYRCPTFRDIIFRCTGDWLKYYVYVQNPSPLEPDSENEPKAIFTSVSQPSTWIAKFSAALAEFKSCSARHPPSQPNCNHVDSTPPGDATGIRTDVKRKACDTVDDAHASPHLRRSKRLKRA